MFRLGGWFSEKQCFERKAFQNDEFVGIGSQVVPEFDEHLLVLFRNQFGRPHRLVQLVLLGFDLKEFPGQVRVRELGLLCLLVGFQGVESGGTPVELRPKPVDAGCGDCED